MECPPLTPGRLIRRYKRFLADVELDDGRIVTAHCPNSGSLAGCLGQGWPVLLSHAPSPRRKLEWTWELVHNGRCWIGINTHRANRLAAEAIRSGAVPGIAPDAPLLGEVRYGKSRVDLVAGPGPSLRYVEVKNVTMVDGDGYAAFPDAPTARGLKHLRELVTVRRLGHRATVLFMVQRTDCRAFRPARSIDPRFADGLAAAAAEGVEVAALLVTIDPPRCTVTGTLPVELA